MTRCAAYASTGDVETCKIIMNEMEARKLKLSRDSYNTLLKAHARCRDADGAVGVLRNMQRGGEHFEVNVFLRPIPCFSSPICEMSPQHSWT